MTMPLTKPPPLMTAFFHTYGSPAAGSSEGIAAGPAYGTGADRLAGQPRHRRSAGLDARSGIDAGRGAAEAGDRDRRNEPVAIRTRLT